VTIYNSVLKSTAVVLMLAFNESIRYCTGNNTKVYTAFLDASKAFDKVLYNGLFVKMFRRNIPVCLVTLLMFWYSHSQCSVRWNDELGKVFPYCVVFAKAACFLLFGCHIIM